MRIVLLVFTLLFAVNCVFAQKERSNKIFQGDEENLETFIRKGRILIESGYNLFGGLPIGGGTGLLSLSDDDNSISGVGLNGGYFVTEDLALKLNFSNLGGEGSDLTSIGLGAKYYIIGKIPIEIGLGQIESDGQEINFSTFTAGYGISLADNINLEPSIGVFRNDGFSLRIINLNFAMFL